MRSRHGSSQAVHWLDFAAFYKEVDRVLKPSEQGWVAIYGYALPEIIVAGKKKEGRIIEKLRDQVSMRLGPFLAANNLPCKKILVLFTWPASFYC